MLAKNFMTAAALGLNEATQQALIRVLHALERGEISKHLFDMRYVGKPECGTPGCLIGWAYSLTDTKKDLVFRQSLVPLTYPWLGAPPLSMERVKAITVAQAAFALRTYLTTGVIDWREAIRVAK